MSIADAELEEHVEKRGEHRIADIAVRPGHRPAFDLALEPRSEHVVVTLVDDGCDEVRQHGEIVRIVRVAHHNDGAACCVKAGEVGVAVAPLGLVDDAGARRQGDFHRPVRRAVVGDDHFTGPARATEPVPRLLDADPDALLFVEARHDDADLHALVLRNGLVRLGPARAGPAAVSTAHPPVGQIPPSIAGAGPPVHHERSVWSNEIRDIELALPLAHHFRHRGNRLTFTFSRAAPLSSPSSPSRSGCRSAWQV